MQRLVDQVGAAPPPQGRRRACAFLLRSSRIIAATAGVSHAMSATSSPSTPAPSILTTFGHEDIVRRAAGLFDEVVMAVATAHHSEDAAHARRTAGTWCATPPAATPTSAAPFDGLARDFLLSARSKVMGAVRGVTDFDYEFQLAGMNRNLLPDVETIFMAPTATLQSVSSTLIRETSQLGGDVALYAAPMVLERLQAQAHRAWLNAIESRASRACWISADGLFVSEPRAGQPRRFRQTPAPPRSRPAWWCCLR